MILSAQSIRAQSQMIRPFREKFKFGGISGGLGSCSYDICIAEKLILQRGDFSLASAVELIKLPHNIMARVCDKSTWARLGITVQNTLFDPGWEGYPTLEISCHWKQVEIQMGMPIAQLVFEQLDHPTELPYAGKYQGQERGAQEARFYDDA